MTTPAATPVDPPPPPSSGTPGSTPVTPPATSSTLQFTEFSNGPGNFSVQFPGAPKTATQVVNGMTQHAYYYETHVDQKHVTFMVSYFDVPPNLQVPTFETAAQRYAGALGLSFVGGAADYSQEDYPGRIFTLRSSGGGITRLGIVLAKQRYYQVILSASPNYANSADAEKYLNSFKITQ